MKAAILFAIVLAILAISVPAPSFATPIFTVTPSGGAISGLPGDTVGWGFTLTPDSVDWISVVTTSFIDESNPGLGFYTDFAGLFGGPVNGVLAPGAAPWVFSFDATNQTGLGGYAIDPGATPGSTNIGVIDLNYETFSADPNICSSCAIGFGDLQAAVRVTAGASAPEPATFVSIALGLAIWGLNQKRARR